jgi:hypothetical protein
MQTTSPACDSEATQHHITTAYFGMKHHIFSAYTRYPYLKYACRLLQFPLMSPALTKLEPRRSTKCLHQRHEIIPEARLSHSIKDAYAARRYVFRHALLRPRSATPVGSCSFPGSFPLGFYHIPQTTTLSLLRYMQCLASTVLGAKVYIYTRILYQGILSRNVKYIYICGVVLPDRYFCSK